MKLSARLVLVVVSVVMTFATAEAKRRSRGDFNEGREQNEGFQNQDFGSRLEQSLNSPADDTQLVQANDAQRRVNFVEGTGMEVVRVLPDDNNGLQHQKWVVRLSNGKLMQAVYNSDMCPRVPIQVGDIVSMGGMFIWTNVGGMIHWLHHDPRGNRPDGYVMVNGTYYCKD